uniref:Uncharacterized protein n=1 Tax=Onchocerca volvulus TaxID=6282 RepID=A0A8R1TUL0_ONCVO
MIFASIWHRQLIVSMIRRNWIQQPMQTLNCTKSPKDIHDLKSVQRHVKNTMKRIGIKNFSYAFSSRISKWIVKMRKNGFAKTHFIAVVALFSNHTERVAETDNVCKKI